MNGVNCSELRLGDVKDAYRFGVDGKRFSRSLLEKVGRKASTLIRFGVCRPKTGVALAPEMFLRDGVGVANRDSKTAVDLEGGVFLDGVRFDGVLKKRRALGEPSNRGEKSSLASIGGQFSLSTLVEATMAKGSKLPLMLLSEY